MTPRLAIQAPPILPGGWRGAIIERHDLGGEALWSATVRQHFGKAWRRWFSDHAAALAYGLETADLHGFPLFDLTGPEPE